MVTRRQFISTVSAGAVLLAAPAILRAQAGSGTPVINGRRIRRKLSTLAANDPFFTAYGQAIEAMHTLAEDNPRSWLAQARIHANFCMHGTNEFFPWHRPYLHYFEKICGELIGDENFALPYWDWRDNNGRLPSPFFADGPLNVLSWSDPGDFNGIGWGAISTVPYRFAREDFGLIDGPAAGSFSQSAMDDMENASTFDLLAELTEGPHGTAHVVVGGNPRWGLGTDTGHFSSGLSPLDPIFWLHHANVDRIWANSTIPVADQKAAFDDISKVYSGVFFDASGGGADAALADTFDLANYGYSYDFLESETLTGDEVLLNKQIFDAQDDLINFARTRGIAVDQPAVASVFELFSSEEDLPAYPRRVTQIALEGSKASDVVTQQRLSRRSLPGGQLALALDSGKVYARFTNVRPQPNSEGALIKVFVNCPYLSELTPTTDSHYAGAISLFGCTPEICASRTFTVDLTTAIRNKLEQGASLDRLQVQLIPFASAELSAEEPVIIVGGVELLGS
tara:strand:+ start:2916 stop:4445 length:1530 start_codon:yes stop_codon:yes gene_type:complete